MLATARFFAFFVLVSLYLAPLPFLLLRNGCHRVLYALDCSFDKVARVAGWDPRFWPLPNSSDSPLPYSEDW